MPGARASGWPCGLCDGREPDGEQRGHHRLPLLRRLGRGVLTGPGGQRGQGSGVEPQHIQYSRLIHQVSVLPLNWPPKPRDLKP